MTTAEEHGARDVLLRALSKSVRRLSPPPGTLPHPTLPHPTPPHPTPPHPTLHPPALPSPPTAYAL